MKKTKTGGLAKAPGKTLTEAVRRFAPILVCTKLKTSLNYVMGNNVQNSSSLFFISLSLHVMPLFLFPQLNIGHNKFNIYIYIYFHKLPLRFFLFLLGQFWNFLFEAFYVCLFLVKPYDSKRDLCLFDSKDDIKVHINYMYPQNGIFFIFFIFLFKFHGMNY